MLYGFDTGFFFELLSLNPPPQVLARWQDVINGTANGVISHVVIYELLKLRLSSRLPRPAVEDLVANFPITLDVIWPTTADQLDRVARISYSEGLSMADSMIIAPALERGAAMFFTSDSDYDGIDASETDIVLLQ